MIFFSKKNNAPGRSSNTEACVSILGLFLAIGLIGGLAALIFGLIKGISSATIGGGIVLGVSALFSIILALVFIYCLKDSNVNSNLNKQRTSSHQHQHKQNRHYQQNRQVNREHASSHEITVISGMHKYDNHPRRQQQQQQQQRTPNSYNLNKSSSSAQSIGLGNSTNAAFDKQYPQSPSKTSSFYPDQSISSMNNKNQHSTVDINIKRDNYNRH